MPNLNCMFLAAPFTLWMLEKYIRRMRRKPEAFPVTAMSVMVAGMVLIQGMGFHSHFAFGDGIYGEKRDAKIENSYILKGMKMCIRDRTCWIMKNVFRAAWCYPGSSLWK